MSGNTILIVTASFDPHADAVISEVEARGGSVFRLNTDRLLRSYEFSIRVERGKWAMTIANTASGLTIRLPEECRAAWYRKPEAAEVSSAVTDPGMIAFIQSEVDNVLTQLYAMREVHWLNPPLGLRRSGAKLRQLALAAECGLATPATMVTNRGADAVDFARAGGADIACKAVATPLVELDGVTHQVLTSRLTEEEVTVNADNVRLAPTLLQTYVEKRSDIRVTVVGERVFGCAIESQAHADARTDVKGGDPARMRHTCHLLPDGVESGLREMVRRERLGYSAFDLVLTPKGEYVFLEHNPNGQWYWVEMLTGMPIAAEVAHALLRGG